MNVKSECVCSLRYPACKAHAPFSSLCPLPLYNIFPHYLIKCKIFEKKITENKMCSDFLYKFARNISNFKKNWERYDQKLFGLLVKFPLLFLDLNETWVFSTNYRKIFKYKISWKSFQWELNCSMRTDGRTDGQSDWQTKKYTDRQRDMTKLIVTFCNFSYAPENCYMFRRPQGVSNEKQYKHQYINLRSTVPSLRHSKILNLQSI